MKANKALTALAIAIGGTMVKDAVVTALEDVLAVEAKRLEVPYWVLLGAAGFFVLALAE